MSSWICGRADWEDDVRVFSDGLSFLSLSSRPSQEQMQRVILNENTMICDGRGECKYVVSGRGHR